MNGGGNLIKISMKNKILSVVILISVMVSSCGNSACDCIKEMEVLIKEGMQAGLDADKAAKFDKDAKALEEKCKGYTAEDYKDCKWFYSTNYKINFIS